MSKDSPTYMPSVDGRWGDEALQMAVHYGQLVGYWVARTAPMWRYDEALLAFPEYGAVLNAWHRYKEQFPREDWGMLSEWFWYARKTTIRSLNG